MPSLPLLKRYRRHSFLPSLCLILFVFFSFKVIANSSKPNEAQRLFSQYAEQVFQIEIIELQSDNKSSIGSGFQISEDGLIATNFHVIANAVHSPNDYRIDLIRTDKTRVEASIVNFDVINDLALLQTNINQTPFELAEAEPLQGSTVYSIGNPSDYGMIVVPGVYNGLTSKSYYQRIHFTGSINPGMSGGPVLNKQGQIIGVNVATGGNSLGFLVPLAKLEALIKHPVQAEYSPKQAIQQQLYESQQDKFDILLSRSWQVHQLGEARVTGELAPFIPCWGDSNVADKKALYFVAGIHCSSKEYIYLNHHFNTGRIEVSFNWYERKQLNTSQFYNMLERKFASASAGNRAYEDDVSNFHCYQDLHRVQPSEQTEKSVLCSRAYKDYPGLFDIIYIAVSVSDNDNALLSHFTLAGVSQENATAFSQRFMDAILWN